MPHIFQFLACGSSPSITSPLVCLVIYSPDNKQPWTVQQTTQHPLCHRQNRKSGFCPLEMASKKHLVSSVLSNPILTPSHVPMWGCAAPQNRLGNSTNDLPGKSQRAAITCSFVDVPLLHRAYVWFLSGRPSFSFSLALTLTSLLSLAHFAVYITYFLSFSLVSLSLCPWHSLSACWPVCLSFSFSLGPASFSPSHLLLLLFHFKIRVSWLCVL